MLFLMIACQVSLPEIEVWASIEGDSVEIKWESITLRPKLVDWYDQWEELSITSDTTSLAPEEEPVKIGYGKPPEARYIHLFTDALTTQSNGVSIGDIIEPIATPFDLDRGYRIDIEYIILPDPDGNPSIFTKDATISEL